MKRVEVGETYLRSLGFYNVRVRVHNEIARIEVDENYFEKIIKMRKEIISFLKGAGFAYVTIDLEGFRSGSMDLFL